jgi:hypothetical protein
MNSPEVNEPSTTSNELYLERLDAFTAKTLADIKTFSARESIPYEQVGHIPPSPREECLSSGNSGSASRRSKALPVPLRGLDTRIDQSAEQCVSHPRISCALLTRVLVSAVHNVLLSTSQVLESLHTTAGVQSFVLAINPNDAEDEGFLGGSSLGREFWRSLRGGGTAGAKTLKSLAISALQNSTPVAHAALHGTPSRSKETAHTLKSDVYARVRALLRDVLGISCHFYNV